MSSKIVTVTEKTAEIGSQADKFTIEKELKGRRKKDIGAKISNMKRGEEFSAIVSAAKF